MVSGTITISQTLFMSILRKVSSLVSFPSCIGDESKYSMIISLDSPSLKMLIKSVYLKKSD